MQVSGRFLPTYRGMADRIINSVWWTAVMTMIGLAGLVAMLLSYRSIFDLLAGRWEAGILSMIGALAAGAGTLALCRHRNDLLID